MDLEGDSLASLGAAGADTLDVNLSFSATIGRQTVWGITHEGCTVDEARLGDDACRK